VATDTVVLLRVDWIERHRRIWELKFDTVAEYLEREGQA
jgi:hypothetical protein